MSDAIIDNKNNSNDSIIEDSNDNNVDTEIEIPVTIKDETETKEESKSEPKEETKEVQVIHAKNIKDLTDEERNIILSNHRSGIENPYFEVKTFKNGNFRIQKKKQNKTVSQKVIESATNQDQNKIDVPEKLFFTHSVLPNKCLTNDQLLMEHIIELNTKFERLAMKHKKLKQKYYNIRDDIYTDVDEENGVDTELENPIEIKPEIQNTSNQKINTNKINVVNRGWRSKVAYL